MVKKLINICLCLLMTLTLIQPSMKSVYAKEETIFTNIALNKPVNASSTAANKLESTAVDGKVESKKTWQINYNGSDYNRGSGDLEEDFTIDLINKSIINTINITWTKTVWAKSLTIEGSFDGKTFFKIKDVNDTSISAEMEVQTIEFDEVETRFVRLCFHTPNNMVYGYELYEVEVFGKEYENIALNKTIEASTSHNSGSYKVEYAVDGDMTTRWGNDYSGDEFNYGSGNTEVILNLDLENLYKIDDMALSFEAAYSSDYTILGSVDKENYFEIKDIINGDGGTDYFKLDDCIVQYIQIQFHKPATKYGYSVYEINVHGEIFEKVNFAMLDALVKETESKDLQLYSDLSVSILNQAIDNAKRILLNEQATDIEVFEAYKNLNSAIGQLIMNIAYQKPINNEQSLLTDGDLNIYCDDKYPKDYILDLSQDYDLKEIQLSLSYKSDDDVYTYDIYSSVDGVTYHKVTNKEIIDNDYFKLNSIRARYIKFEFTYHQDDENIHISEIRVFASEARIIGEYDLNQLIASIEQLDLSLYTTTSVEQLNNDIEYAKDILNNDSLTNEMLSQAYVNILYSKNNLLLKNNIKDILNTIKSTPPQISKDYQSIILPKIDLEGYKVELYGSSNESVIDLNGKIYTPLEDMEVHLSYKIVNTENNKDCYFDNYSETSITIKGQYERLSQDNQRPDVLPALREWKGLSGEFVLKDNSRIVIANNELKETADMIVYYFKEMLNIDIEVVEGEALDGDIYLALSSHKELGKEGYYIEINDKIIVNAYDLKGILYAGTTLTQILSTNKDSLIIPKGIIRDYPAYEVRSMMIDVARMYIPLDYLKEMSKYMAYFKMNEVHVHINDVGGEQSAAYRIESKLYPQINSNLDKDEVYSQEDYRNFQKEVKKYGIDVVTELDSPAHAGFVGLYDKSLIFSGKYIDLTKPKAKEFIKSLIDELLDGENPVIQSSKFHIGVDEYPQKYQDLAREYTDELIKYVNAKGYETRLWAALGGSSGLGGNVEVTNEAVCNIWSPHYSDPKLTVDMGYDVINNNRTYLYVVPGSSLDRNIFEIKQTYELWEVEDLPGLKMATSSPQLLGAEAAFWYDNNRGISEFDAFKYIKDQFIVIAEKTWVGHNVSSTEKFEERIDLFDDYTPGCNPYRYVESQNEDVVMYDFKSLNNDKVVDLTDNHYDALIHNLSVVKFKDNQVLQLDGNGFMSLPFESIGFPYTVSFDFYLDQDVKENSILFDGTDANGIFYLNYNGTNQMAYVRKGFVHTFDFSFDMGQWYNITLSCDNKDLVLYIDDIKFGSGTPALSNSISTTFVLPVESIGSGIVGKIDNFNIKNKYTSYEEILNIHTSLSNLALNKQTYVSGLEVDDGRFSNDLAVDGSSSTRVSFEKKDDAWFVVDLGDLYWVNEIEVEFNECPNQYELYVSEDNEQWVKVYEDLNCQGGKADLVSLTFAKGIKARYVKYQQLEMFKSSDNDKYYSGNFTEFRVFGSLTNRYNDLMNKIKDIINYTVINDSNKNFIEYLKQSIDLIENYLTDSQDIDIALHNLENELDKFESGDIECSKLNKAELKALVKTKRSNKTTYCYYYRRALKAFIDSSCDIEEIQFLIDKLYELTKEVNIIYNKSISASVGDTSKINDGIIGENNYWDGGKYPSEFIVDLGNDYYINEFKVYPLYRGHETRTYQYEIYTSLDNINYELVAEKKTDIYEVVEGTSYVFEEELKAHYIKVVMTKNNVNDYVHMSEFEAFGKVDEKVDKTDLNQLIEDTLKIDTNIYTIESLLVYKDALAKSNDALNDENITLKDLYHAYNKLYNSIESLQMIRADYTKVNEALDKLPDDLSIYTKESIETLNNAISAVVYDLDVLKQDEVDKMAQEIVKALNALEEIEVIVQKDLLLSKIEAYKAVKAEAYTKESYDGFKAALDTAKAVLADEQASQDAVDTVLSVLEDAYKALVKKPALKPFPFTDVSDKQWYYGVINEAYQLGLMSGATETLFKPNTNMNRGMVAIVFHRMEGSKKVEYSSIFPDVANKQYYTTSVLWAKQTGVINGYTNGTFKPLRNVTREEMATMIYNFARYKGLDMSASKDITYFDDYNKITPYAVGPLQWAVEKGLMSGKLNGTKLDPLGTATRAECSKMLVQAYKVIYK